MGADVPRHATSLTAPAGALSRFTGLVAGGRLLPYLRKGRDTTAMIQVNLFLAMPELGSSRRLRSLARRTAAYRLYNDLDFELLPWRPHAAHGLERLRECLADGRGAVVCSLHVGAYRRVFDELVRRGFDVTLIADRNVAATLKRDTLARLAARGAGAERLARVEAGLEVVDAEQPGAVRRAFEALDSNRLVLVYLDGNTGAAMPGGEDGGAAGDPAVEFFGRRVALPAGACRIAWLKRVPIVPLFASWERRLRPSFRCLPPLRPAPGQSLAGFCDAALQELVSLCEREVRRRPAQFEHWVYLHRWRWLPGEAASTDGLERARREIGAAGGRVRYGLDPGRVLLVAMGGRQVLVDGVRGRLVEAGRLLADVLVALRRRRASYETLCSRLAGRHSGLQVLEALARLKAMGCLVEAPDAGRAR